MESSATQQHNDPGKRFGLALFYFLVCAAIAGAVTVVRLMLWNKGMGEGEALAYQIASLPNPTAVEAEARSFAQQPLYYLLAHHWMRITGVYLFTLRLFSALWGIAWLMLLYPAGAWVAGRREGGWLAMGVAAASPFAAYASLSAGPDAMLAALALASCIPFIEFTKRQTPAWAWPAWAGATLLLMLTHPLAVAVPLFQAVCMLLLRRDKSIWFRRGWLALLCAVFLGYLILRGAMPPEAERQVAMLVPESMKQLQLLMALSGLGLVNGGPPTPLMTVQNYTALSVFSCLGAGAAFLWTLGLRREHPQRARVLALFAVVPAAVLFFACTSFKTTVMWNHFAFFSSSVFLMVTFVMMRGKGRTGRAALAALVLIVNAIGFHAYIRAPHLSCDWRGAYRHIVSNDMGANRDLVSVVFAGPILSLAPPDHRPLTGYYARQPGSVITVTAATLSPLDHGFQTAPSVLAAQAAHSEDCFWIVVKTDTLEKEMPLEWRRRFFTLHHSRTFRSVFTGPDLFVEKLCAKQTTKALRAMSREHFVDFLLGVPEQPNPLENRYARANFFFEKGYMDMAEREMLAIKKHYGDLRGVDLNLCFIYLSRGKQERDLEQLGRALGLCRSAKEDEPGNTYIDSLTGEILFHLERFEECRAPLEAAVNDKALCRDNAGACVRASYFLGAALYRLNKKEAALPLLMNAVPSPDMGPKASYLLGVAYYELGFPADAVPHLKRVAGVKTLGGQAAQLLKRIELENPDLFKTEKRGRFQIETR